MVNKKVATVGLWHLGSIYATSLAELGFEVVGFDLDKKVISDFTSGKAPIFEPGLDEMLQKHNGKNLTFSSDVGVLENKDYIFITHDLEVDDNDVAQTKVLDKIFTLVSKHCAKNCTVVVSSQVSVGSSRTLISRMCKEGITNPKVIYFPENLKLGDAFNSFLKPERIVLGSDDKELSLTLEQDLGLGCPTVSMGLESAEMVKHALNIYLATCISLSGELSDLAEIMGADMVDVVKALKLDRRVSPYAPLSPGMGFAGGTLGRDVQSLRMLAKNHKYNSKFLNAVYGVNQDRLPYLVTKIMKMYPKLLGKKIGLLGLTYKANTNTLRRSMSMELARMLHMKGAQVRAFDPVIKEPIKGSSYIKVCNEGEDFFKDLDLIVLMTDWKEFLAIEPELIASLCKKKIIIDTKNFLDREKFKTAGFTYIGIGIQ